MMNCEEFHKFIDDYVYGEVSFFVKAQMDAHIASCPKCREEAAFLKQIEATLHAMPRLEVDDSFQAALNKKIDGLELAAKRNKKYKFFRDWRTYSALAACLILAVVVQSRLSDFYKQGNHPNPVQSQAENVTDIDLSGMQEHGEQRDSVLPPQDAAPSSTAQTADTSAAAPARTAAPNSTEAVSERKIQNTPEETQKPADREEPQSPTASPADRTAAPQTAVRPTAEPQPEQTPAEQQSRAVTDAPAAAPQQSESNLKTAAEDAMGNGEAADAADAEAAVYSSAPPVSAGGSGSGDSYASALMSPVGGTVSVDAENVSKAKEIADRYGVAKGGVIEMEQKNFQNYLNSLEKNDIPYSHTVPEADVVNVEIVAD